jgi:ABC-type multidrug transport system permease subunit
MLRNLVVYVLAVLCGVSAGILEITLNDLLVTALFILICTMVLGAARPRRAWQWIVIVGIFVPLARLVSYLALNQRPYRAQVWESALGFVTAAVGSYCGVFARKAVTELFRPARAQDT